MSSRFMTHLKCTRPVNNLFLQSIFILSKEAPAYSLFVITGTLCRDIRSYHFILNTAPYGSTV